MKRVTGIGGIFFKAKDVQQLTQWYHQHLGIRPGEFGGTDFFWRDKDNPQQMGRTVWSVFPDDTDYFGQGDQTFMINYRVDNLDELLQSLRQQGVRVEERIEDHEFGRFVWIIDPEGNRIELWEPAGEERSP